MVLSINTNSSAAIALQSLNQTTRDLDEVGNRINTGFKVAGAKDDGAIYSIAQGMRADVEGIGVAIQSLNRAKSTVDVALAAGESISDLLIEMKAKALAGADTSITSTDRAAYNADYVALLEQVNTIIQSADFNGSNIIDGTLNTQGSDIQVLASFDSAQRLTVQPVDFDALIFETAFDGTPAQTLTQTAGSESIGSANFDTTFGGNIGLGGSSAATTRNNFQGFYSNGADLATSAGKASAMASAVDAVLDKLNNELATLGTQSKKLELQTVFLSKLEDSFVSGIGNLVDANLAKESARLQALQIKQQLGTQALSIANSRPQTIIQLFQ